MVHYFRHSLKELKLNTENTYAVKSWVGGASEALTCHWWEFNLVS